MFNGNNCGSSKRTTIILSVLGISQSIVYYFMNFSACDTKFFRFPDPFLAPPQI